MSSSLQRDPPPPTTSPAQPTATAHPTPPAASLPWAPLALVALVILAFAPTLGFGFVYDDRWTLLDNPVVRSPANLWRLWGAEFARAGVPDAARPIMLATEIVDWASWGPRPRGFHLQNLIWHAVVVIAWWALLRRLGLGALAFAAAALFAVHPLVVEPVATINYREDLLAAAFLLAGLHALIADDGSRGSRAGRWFLAGLATAIAAFAKESASTAPLLALAAALTVAVGARPQRGASEPTTRPRLIRVTDTGVLLFAVGVAILWRWWAVGQAGAVSATAEIPEAHRDLAFFVPRAAITFLTGLAQFFVPLGNAPEYPDLASGSAVSWLGVGAWVAVVVTSVALWRRRVQLPALSFAWLLALAGYLPHLGFVPLTNLRADRYFYLSTLGFSLAAAALGAAAIAAVRARLPGGGRAGNPAWPTAILGVVVVALALRSRVVARVYADDARLFTAALAAAPGSQRAAIGLALAELRRGQSLAALAAAEIAVGHGDSARARETRGLVRLAQGDLPAARRDLERALELATADHEAQVLTNLGHVEKRAGDLAAAERHLERAERLAPRSDRPAVQRALLAWERGDLPRARQLLTALLGRVPESSDGWRLLAMVEERAGDGAAAARARTHAARLGGGQSP